MRIVSLNTWAGRLLSPLLQFVKEVNADVFCFQEVYWASSDTPTPLRFKHPQKPDMRPSSHPRLFAELESSLPQYQSFFLPAMCGTLYDEEDKEYRVQYGLATFVRDGIPIIGQQTSFVYDEYRPGGWRDSPISRNAHAFRLWRFDVERALVVAHMHGLWHPSGKGPLPEREDQATSFGHLIEGTRESGDEVVACGDFNVLPEDTLFYYLGKWLHLQDLVTERGHTDTRTSYYKKNPRHANYMFVSPNIKVLKFDVPAEPEVSDHRPLVLDIE